MEKNLRKTGDFGRHSDGMGMVPMRLEIAQTGAFLAATRAVMAMMQADNGTVVKAG